MELEDLEKMAWFVELAAQVQQAVDRIADQQPNHTKALRQEWHELDEQRRGWSQSLAKPDLHPALRAEIETNYAAAVSRQQNIERQIAEYDESQRNAVRAVTPAQVVERLNRLDDVLARGDPTMGNLELSLHIESIRCSQSGQVIVRSCKLGALAPAMELLAEPVPQPGSRPIDTANETPRGRPRRRARLRITEAGNGVDAKATAQVAADTQRFAGLGPEWFWEDTFQIPERTCWSEEHADAVITLRVGGMTIEQLAKHFGRTPPTIRKALRAGMTTRPGQKLPRKIPRPCWAKNHAGEVLKLKQAGMSTDEIAERLGKSDTTIRTALEHASSSSTVDHSGSHVKNGLRPTTDVSQDL
jgi:transposase